MTPRTGLWLVGARGGIAATVAVGLAALKQGAAATTGLVTEGPRLGPLVERLDPIRWDSLVLGGHDIRSTPLAEAARLLENQNGALPHGSAAAYADELAEADRRIRPGVAFRSGPAIERLTEAGCLHEAATPRAAIDQIRADLEAFAADNSLDRVVVVFLGSTEPPVDTASLPARWEELGKTLSDSAGCPLRASSLYAIAAIEAGMPFVNFTPSLGSDCEAIDELARQRAVCHAGRDGKTGETLLKTVLAPMFAERNLEVMSWVGHNIFGNRDGEVLDDPEHKATKVHSKDAVLPPILGYAPQTLVSIESIRSLGDWKTAWDHVHFRGFMGVPMTLQLTWQGCDSALAAPLVLDLARLIDLAQRHGEAGVVRPLAGFFKSPMGASTSDFGAQSRELVDWVASLNGAAS
ncbi:Inositol-3-phosphate synthase [Pseudobythopirellula maris]|uniref:Inositol-3-phosphate synthase n=1 Tax=Pseudobythopirellula maris TaxID=2527991 RepID=A0A5C5ZVF6_9BACT|nr:inositol-3-phosphate synthase [Pseudobythopirellula maris]TWT90987.1 Inositol-3-phosphate synthase [Pseudobythopirellula maris]